MSTWSLWLRLLPLCALLLACSQTQAPPQPSAFSRPSQVAFACLRVGESSVTALPMASCDPDQVGQTEGVLHALVTQTATGEVAAVDLSASKVIDDRSDVPGYTFVDVGPLPSAIVVPERAAAFAYVGNAAGEIGVFRTAGFRPIQGQTFKAKVQEPAVKLPGLARAGDMVVSPDERALFVASPSTGELYVIPICRDPDSCEVGTLLEPQAVALAAPALRNATRGPVGEPYESFGDCAPYEFLTDAPAGWDGGVADSDMLDAGTPDAGTTGAGAADAGSGNTGASPRPVALAIDRACDGQDGCAPRLLVADDVLPVIHRFEIDGSSLAAIEPLYPGVPTAALAVTPDVPVEVGGDAMTHYVYAVDHEDGSVLVLQDGAVLPVNDTIGGPVDRLAFGEVTRGARALSLAVVTPAANYAEGVACVEPPQSLGGVFLTVGTSDGRILVFDIHDEQLHPSETYSGVCRACPFAIRRHRLRGASTFRDFLVTGLDTADPAGKDAGAALEPVTVASSISDSPLFSVGSRTYTIDRKGVTRSTDVPSLSCFECPSGMVPAWPPPSRDTETEDVDGTVFKKVSGCRVDESHVCLDADPFRPTGESWVAVYEGLLDGTAGIGAFSSETTFDVSAASGVNLCSAGVLDAAQLGDDSDQLILLPVPDTLAAAAPSESKVGGKTVNCRQMFQALSDGERAVAFAIQEAYADHVVLGGSNLLDSIADASLRSSLPDTLAEVFSCLQGVSKEASSAALSFAVRTRHSFLVAGTLTPYENRVREAADGRCELDPDAPAYRERRAQVTEDGSAVFNNGRIAFALQGALEAIETTESVSLQLPVDDANPKLVYDAAFRASSFSTGAAVIPQVMRFASHDQRLYIVDPHSRGLFSILLWDFTTASANVKQFN